MINQEQKLNQNLFDDKVEMRAIRTGFGEGLLLAGEKDQRIVGLCADLAESTQMHLFKNRFPERFIEIGVAEQNLASVASGMARMGKIPFVSSYAVFSPGRNWEQIRTTICYNNVPVKIVGSHAGVSVGPDGGSHQALEDIAITRVLPRMTVISPCDAIEAKKAILACAGTSDPTYIRLAREKTPIITTQNTSFAIGHSSIFFKSKSEKENKSVAIIATGHLVYNALTVAKRLADEGIGVSVLNLSTIKPLDEHTIIRLAHEYRAIVTVEEHQIIGGMGSAVSECLSSHYPTPIEFIGVKDKFGQSGEPDQLLQLYGMNEKDIYNACHKVILRK